LLLTYFYFTYTLSAFADFPSLSVISRKLFISMNIALIGYGKMGALSAM